MTKTAVAVPSGEVELAAARLFRQKGYASTTLREIAAAAGMLPGSLHYRYPSKESILLALMERAIATLLDTVQRAVAPSQDPLERIRLGLRAHLRLLLDGDDSVYVLLYDWRALVRDEQRESMTRLRDRYEAFWDGLLYEALGSGRVRAGVDPRLVRLLGFGAVDWVPQWYDPACGLEPEDIADALFATMVLGVLADAHRPPDAEAAFEALAGAAFARSRENLRVRKG